MNDKPPYIFSKEHWLSMTVWIFVSVGAMNGLKSYTGILLAGLIGIILGSAGFFLTRRKLATTAVFRENEIVLQKGVFSKERIISYNEITRLNYVIDRFQYAYLFMGSEKVKLPPIPFLKSEGFFKWLKSRNSLIIIEVQKP